MNLSATTIIIVVGLKIALAFIPANMAKKKGYSFWGFFAFGALAFLPSAITIHFLQDKLSSDNDFTLQQLLFKKDAESSNNSFKTCYLCGSRTPRDAKVCPLCKAKLQ